MAAMKTRRRSSAQTALSRSFSAPISGDMKFWLILSTPMTDAADPVRVEAVRALHQLGGDESVLLLRLKARLGDRRHIIIGHVFDALLNMERERAVPFVGEYLNSRDEELRDESALALGSSRLPDALGLLIQTWNEVQMDSYSGVLLRAISSSRLPAAIDFLLNVLRTGSARQSVAAGRSPQASRGLGKPPDVDRRNKKAPRAISGVVRQRSMYTRRAFGRVGFLTGRKNETV
jgi:hypothetical protein